MFVLYLSRIFHYNIFMIIKIKFLTILVLCCFAWMEVACEFSRNSTSLYPWTESEHTEDVCQEHRQKALKQRERLRFGKAIVRDEYTLIFPYRGDLEDLLQIAQYDPSAATECIMAMGENRWLRLPSFSKVVVLNVRGQIAQIVYQGDKYWCLVAALENL